MRRIHASQDEDQDAEGRRIIRELVARWDAEADSDGGAA
jgi:hypothetical protein